MIEISANFDPGYKQITPLEQGLHDHNLAHLGEAIIQNYHELAVSKPNDEGEIIGGVWDI